ncbi:small integral membrane protein 8 isoform X1 [Puntigrus tetrazona]|uniref:small integral membrane protein 8 isoform X1 n=1 Tax=Puntigrus tetrazona TaxID=1606681 RepID=UPI001C8AAED5|nr:small integral membrane protein 8 isoform X1 [Puntigrus tetrazona]
MRPAQESGAAGGAADSASASRGPGLRGVTTTSLFRALNPELFIRPAKQAGDGRGSAEPHAVCGVPGLPARAPGRPAAAVRGGGRPGRETHEEEELPLGLRRRKRRRSSRWD